MRLCDTCGGKLDQYGNCPACTGQLSDRSQNIQPPHRGNTPSGNSEMSYGRSVSEVRLIDDRFTEWVKTTLNPEYTIVSLEGISRF